MNCPVCDTEMLAVGHGDEECPVCGHLEYPVTWMGEVEDTYERMERVIGRTKDQH